VQQFQQEGCLRWDSLGEFSALAARLKRIASRSETNGRRCWPRSAEDEVDRTNRLGGFHFGDRGLARLQAPGQRCVQAGRLFRASPLA
jgi:hypothetical protein